MPPRVARSLLLGDPPLLRGLAERHVLTVQPQDATAIHGALESAKRTVNVLLLANFDSNSYMTSQVTASGNVM